MKKTIGINPTYRADETGGLISVCWHCPYCGGYNGGAYFTLKSEVLQDDFVMDHDCEFCGEKVSVVCVDAVEDPELLSSSFCILEA